MQPAMPSRPGGSAAVLKRYGPFLAIAVVIALVVVFLGGGGDDDGGGGGTGSTDPADGNTADGLPVTYQEAEEAGTVDDHDWGPNCDAENGRVAIPASSAVPCVPVWEGDNGGATSQGVTADSIRIGYYVAKEDPQFIALLQLAGAYDEPEDVVETLKNFTAIYQELYETYGRKVELVRVEGSGLSNDEEAARADAVRAAKELNLFAVIGGPAQAKAFAEELAANGVMCIGSCLIAQPQQFYLDNRPYIWNTGPSPDQTADHTIEFIEKQMAGKPATFAGDEHYRSETRRFALLTYDTLDGNFKVSWDTFVADLETAGIELETHVTYFLDLAKAPEDARTIVTKLKESDATTVIFSGDPIMPQFFTNEAEAQGYRPEWLMAGTVFADTTVFARTFNQEQWAHAFGIQLIPVRTPPEEGAPRVMHNWWYGTNPPAENGEGIILGNAATIFTGIHLAGPDLSAQSFAEGIYRLPVPEQGPLGLRAIVTYSTPEHDHGIWPYPDDPNGLDDAALIWWDPEAKGPDETGNEDQDGMYRLVDGGRRYLPGKWPTEPMPLFDPEGTVTVYESTPEELLPQEYPTHPDSPVAQEGGG